MKNKSNFIIRVVTTTLFIIALILAIVVGSLNLLGYQRFKVISDSMSPTLNTGDLIIVKHVSPVELKSGDIITYRKSNSNITITHRIWKIDFGEKVIYTAGDNNSSKDAESVPFANVIGKYINFKIPKLFG